MRFRISDSSERDGRRPRRLSNAYTRPVFNLAAARMYAYEWRQSGGSTEYVINGPALWLRAWRPSSEAMWRRIDVGPVQFKAFETWLSTSAGMVRRASAAEAALLALA